jgi:ferric-dicitrate binding protein FerR (iron transport regulator)
MAYFQHKSGQDASYTRRFAPPSPEQEETWSEEEDAWGEEEPLYDDGFDEMDGEPEEEPLSPEERRRENRRRFRIAAGFGNLGATLVGVAVILVLSALLIQMVHFATSDLSQNFTLFATHF